MTYSKVEEKKMRQMSRQKIIDIYLESKTWPEFMIAIDLEGLRLSRKLDVLACKLHHLKRSYEALWAVACVCSLVGFAGFAVVAGLLLGASSFVFCMIDGALAWLVAAIVFQYMFGDFMLTLDWYEHGCPIVY